MKLFYIDYFILDEKKERVNKFYETIELYAENYEEAEKKLFSRIGSEAEIYSVFNEDEDKKFVEEDN